jgi:hypothetical protein
MRKHNENENGDHWNLMFVREFVIEKYKGWFAESLRGDTSALRRL